MASISLFLFIAYFKPMLWRHILRNFYNEILAVTTQFESKNSYEIKCAGWFTFQTTRYFLSSLDNAITVKTLNIGTPRAATVVVLNIKQFNFTMT